MTYTLILLYLFHIELFFFPPSFLYSSSPLSFEQFCYGKRHSGRVLNWAVWAADCSGSSSEVLSHQFPGISFPFVLLATPSCPYAFPHALPSRFLSFTFLINLSEYTGANLPSKLFKRRPCHSRLLVFCFRLLPFQLLFLCHVSVKLGISERAVCFPVQNPSPRSYSTWVVEGRAGAQRTFRRLHMRNRTSHR
jgi:hypothetical protein